MTNKELPARERKVLEHWVREYQLRDAQVRLTQADHDSKVGLASDGLSYPYVLGPWPDGSRCVGCGKSHPNGVTRRGGPIHQAHFYHHCDVPMSNKGVQP